MTGQGNKRELIHYRCESVSVSAAAADSREISPAEPTEGMTVLAVSDAPVAAFRIGARSAQPALMA